MSKKTTYLTFFLNPIKSNATMAQIEELIIKPQEPTQRVKGANFSRVTTVEETDHILNLLWQEAEQFAQPLTQARVIMPLTEEEHLLEAVPKFNGTLRLVNGRIPFSVDGQGLAIYYLQESVDRKRYSFGEAGKELTHQEAVERGYNKRLAFDPKRVIDDQFSIQVDDYSGEEGVNILTGDKSNLPKGQFIDQLIQVHKRAFAYPHDESQRQEAGIREILDNNPIITGYDNQNQIIASVGFWEADSKFDFGGIKLVEQTYFTDPNYEKNGLSIAMRKATQDLVINSKEIAVYGKKPVIIFNESIRATSFPLCLQVGCDLGGSIEAGFISGDLGDAYTYIGPANPRTGLMPMGLTYFIDPRIRYT